MDRLAGVYSSTMQEYYARCREAECYRSQEQQAAVVLQACWRGCLQRQELEKLRHVAVTIQRCWRGYLGRRRFAAVLAAHNTQLRQAYFDHHATTIQRCWRGHYSRSHIHDFYKRKAFLQSVAAANAAVREGMQAELQEALNHQQLVARAAAKQQFDEQVSKLHYLSSRASIPGIFSSPATAAAVGPGHRVYSVAGQPLEHHLKAAVQRKAAAAVKQQQTVLRHALGNTHQGSGIFPAGVPSHAPGSSAAAATGCSFVAPGQLLLAAAATATAPIWTCSSNSTTTVTDHSGVSGPDCSLPHSGNCGNNTGFTMGRGTGSTGRSSQQQLPQGQKLAHRIVETCMDQVFAAKAAANMPDGSFNPGLSLQQSAEYEAMREAADLDRRLDRGLMYVLHKGQPFIPNCSDQPGSFGSCSSGADEGSEGTKAEKEWGPRGPHVDLKQHWKHNHHTGGMFSRHLKQVY